MKNLRVGVKLGLGFGAILLLTIVMAVVSVQNLGALAKRSQNMELSGVIQADVLRFSFISLDNDLYKNEEKLQEVDALFVRTERNITELKGQLETPSNRDVMDALLQDGSEYGAVFAKLLEAQKARQASTSKAVELGVASDRLISALNTQINGGITNPVIHTNQTRALAGRAVWELLDVRRSLSIAARSVAVRGEAAMPAVESALSRIERAVVNMRNLVTPEEWRTLQDFNAQVKVYVEGLRRLANDMTEAQEATNLLTEINQRALEKVDFITDRQSERLAEVAENAETILIIVAVLSVMLGIFISWLIVRQILQPLQNAVQILDTIGQNDLREQEFEQRRDEFGVFLGTLDKTRSALAHVLGEVNGFTTQLAAAAEQLSAVTTQTSAGVNSQREETEQVATAMNEMTATVYDVSKNAEQSVEAIQRASRIAEHGEQVLQGALDANNRLSSQVVRSAEAMHELNEDSNNISTVLTVINGIAEQTNLLALNAAIEAARAGEAGRGFAVVADEVRGLAQRTQESTAQIEELIARLQTGSGNAVNMMENCRGLATSTLELMAEASNELQSIVNVVAEVQAMGMQIATAAEQQSAVAEEINRSVVNVNSIADQSAAATEETAASSAELARLGQELQALVARFRLP